MQKKVVLLLVLFTAISMTVFAQSKKTTKEAADIPDKGDFALVFNLDNILAAVSPYNDGYQAGAGIKYWFSNKLGGRGLVFMLMEPDTSGSITSLALSAALEYHPLPGRISPYVGGILGSKFRFTPTQNYLNYFLGGLGGLEVRVLQNFAIYAEYQAILLRDDDGFWFKLGTDAFLGLVIYF